MIYRFPILRIRNLLSYFWAINIEVMRVFQNIVLGNAYIGFQVLLNGIHAAKFVRALPRFKI